MCEDSRVDPIMCLNGFYTGVKVENVPSDIERGSMFMLHRLSDAEKAAGRPFEHR